MSDRLPDISFGSADMSGFLMEMSALYRNG